jgi:predicted DCC family thiol-disulfide oxidoreductase YuxK
VKDKVYYDESCYVCSLEINTIRERGEACGIRFVDISSADLGFADRNFESEMIGEFDGAETVGAETLRMLYDKMGFHRSVAFSRLPVIKQLFNAGYYTFAYWVRPFLPRKKL